MSSQKESAVTVRQLTTADMPALYALRLEVLRPGMPPEAAIFPGDDVSTTVHLGAFQENGRCVGIATLVENDGLQLRGMAVAPGLQGHGIGAEILKKAYRVTADQGRDSLWCNARTSASGFYAKQGWLRESDQFDIPTVGPHYKMRYRVAR